MACRGCLECLLKLLNFLLSLAGLAMVGYGIYLLVEWKRVSEVEMVLSGISTASGDHEFSMLGRPMLLVSLSTSILDKLPKAWFIYLFIAIGVILFIISCFGCIGVVTRNGCCLTCVIPVDKTGDFDTIYSFLKKNWKIAKWVALGAVILEVLAFLLAVIIRASNSPADYDSDDEYIAPRSSSIHQPLINRQVPAAGVPVAAGSLDQRSNTWSTRMREKYGLNTPEFTYNPSDSSRATAPQSEERSRCSIM